MMEQVIDGYVNDHPIIIERILPDGYYKKIEWAYVCCIDGTRPFLRFGEYEYTTWVRTDLIRKDNA
jgi:hypothetical protein